MPDLNLPVDFIRRMRNSLGDAAGDFFHALSQSAPVSIRVNPFKQKQDNAIATDYGLPTTDSVKWCDDGYYLNERPPFIYDPLFHAGCYYVQEASSMFAGTVAKRLLEHVTNPVVLDAAAAPGGKATHLLSALNERGFLISNEVISQRNSVLQENIWKWGVSNQCITQQPLHEFAQAEEFFDLILLDAPCSGEGLFRRDAAACNEWSLPGVEGCAVRQKQLIEDLLPALKVGGYLIYSTCTFAEKENDDNVESALQNFPVETVDVEIPDGVVQTKHGYQFYPHRINGEGFYISVLKKTSDVRHKTSARAMKRKKMLRVTKAFDDNWNWDNKGFVNRSLGDFTCAIPEHAETLLEQLAQFNLRSIGTPLFEMVNNRAVPHPALALHHRYQPKQIVELELDNALQYLYGDALVNQTDIKQGYAVTQYKGHNLGWVKAASNRFNNLYPHPWRIRKRKSGHP